jgi:FkbM family methyltransferase
MSLSQAIRQRGRAALREIGIEVSRSANPFLKLLTAYKIDVILDVGANEGQFATWVRRLGYTGRIVSFEPIASAYATLQRLAANDGRWETVNIALGDDDGEAEINRSAQTTMSSLAEQTELTRRTFTNAGVVARDTVVIRRLDSIFDGFCRRDEVVLLKIDTQGFEKRVLDGTVHCMERIAGARLELSYQPLYDGEWGFDAMVEYMRTVGFTLVMLEPVGFESNPPRVLQADGTFIRTQLG